MEAILLGIYGFFVWLIFIKLKWLPWNIKSQVIVAIIPIVGLTLLILLLNVYAPSSSDVRVFKYTVPIVSQVRGRVIEVPVAGGQPAGQEGRRAVPDRSHALPADRQPAPGAARQRAGAAAPAGRIAQRGQGQGGRIDQGDRPGERAGTRGAGEDAARQPAGAAEPRAGGDRRGQQVRSGEAPRRT